MRKRNFKKLGVRLFAVLWELSPSAAVVAAALGVPEGDVVAWADRLRRAGVDLKEMPAAVPPGVLELLAPRGNCRRCLHRAARASRVGELVRRGGDGGEQLPG